MASSSSSSSGSAGAPPGGPATPRDITPTVLVVADPPRIGELEAALTEPLPNGPIEVLVSTGGDDTIDLFESRTPRVVVLTATLELGDAKSLMEALREMVPRERMVIVLVGDDSDGVVRTALDAIDMKPDRFVSRPLSPKALRFAVQSGLDNVARALGETSRGNGRPQTGAPPVEADPADSGAIRALAGSPVGTLETAVGSSPVIVIGPRPTFPNSRVRLGSESAVVIGDDDGSGSIDIDTDDIDDAPAVSRTPTPLRGSGAPLRERIAGESPGQTPPTVGRAPTDRGLGLASVAPAPKHGVAAPAAPTAPAPSPSRPRSESAGPLRARWEALADSIASDDLIDDEDVQLDVDVELDDGAPPLPPIEVETRKKPGTNPDFLPVPPVAPWRPGSTSAVREEDIAPPPVREPTLIIDDPPPATGPGSSAALSPPHASSAGLSLTGVTATTSTAEPSASLVTPLPSLASSEPAASPADPASGEPVRRWSHPVLLSDLIDRSRDSSMELLSQVKDEFASIDDLDDEIIVGHSHTTPPPNAVRSGRLDALEDLMEPVPPPELGALETSAERPPPVGRPSASGLRPSAPRASGFGGSGTSPGFSSGAGVGGSDTPPSERFGAGRDFARQLRAKMSQMAQRLFQSDSPAQAPSPVDVRPRHDHHTEIDLAALGEEPAFGAGVTEIERARVIDEPRGLTTSPGSWDTAVRERGIPDAGDIVRGSSDVPMILARMFAQSFTGRLHFRRAQVEKIVLLDQGRPVFASSNEHGDRMGELLVREGKITASQYERCQIHVEKSGRRMGEILVDFGYLKRRELLPAVRRHVEDIVYSLFGWEDGVYQVVPEETASAERIRLSRHPASLVLEGIRRKLGRTTLEKLLGPASTVLEVPDRERLGGIVNAGDLAAEERVALAAFDGQADLAHVARVTGVDVADVLPLAWGLCVLGLATARRTELEISDDSTALVGETDLAIDRERVRARWELVTEADYFALLGVRRDATTFEIRRAYQSARRDFAVDAFPGDLRRELARELEDIANVLDEAFRVLRDDRLRLTYLSNLIE